MRAEVAAAFEKQAEWAGTLGSPFMAALCAALPYVIDDTTETGRRIAHWRGEPVGDALPIRIAGALHAAVRAGRAPALAKLYPPGVPDPASLVGALRETFVAIDGELAPWLLRAPQTNEVARSAVLMPGMLAIAAATGLPLRILELGASAGLNLRLDRYAYDLGGLVLAPEAAPIRLKPEWRGPPPPAAEVRILTRRGVDLAPVDVTEPQARGRLLAYVWPDQDQRLDRIARALDAAAADPVPIDRGEAANWAEYRVQPQAGSVTVLFHSIAFQYFPAESQARIAAHMEAAGSRATRDAPLAWLRYEPDDPAAGVPPTLRLRMWPDGEDRLLARAHPHGAFVHWLGPG